MLLLHATNSFLLDINHSLLTIIGSSNVPVSFSSGSGVWGLPSGSSLDETSVVVFVVFVVYVVFLYGFSERFFGFSEKSFGFSESSF